MSNISEDWSDIVEENKEIVLKEDNTVKTVKKDKTVKNNKIDKNDNITRIDKSNRTDQYSGTDRTDKSKRTDQIDKTDKTDRTTTENTYKKKYYPNIACWFLVNNYQCKQTDCWFNHNPDLVKEYKLKRERKVCHLYLKCKDRCNKYHNMDELMELYNSANNKLETISSIMKS